MEKDKAFWQYSVGPVAQAVEFPRRAAEQIAMGVGFQRPEPGRIVRQEGKAGKVLHRVYWGHWSVESTYETPSLTDVSRY